MKDSNTQELQENKQREAEDLWLSVVMPVFNEAATLAAIVEKVRVIPNLLELIIVDDCSTYGTEAIARECSGEDARIRYSRLSKNSGKTAALKIAFSQTRGDIVVIQDADLEYDPDEICGVAAPIVEGHADVVFGSRFMIKKTARVLYFNHYIANKFLTFFSNCVTNLNLSDVETCYKAFRGEIIRNMKITSSGFGFEIEATAKVAKLGCAVYEVPISYYGRTYEEGKKIGFRDGVAALFYILKYNWLTSFDSSYANVAEIEPCLRKRLPVNVKT